MESSSLTGPSQGRAALTNISLQDRRESRGKINHLPMATAGRSPERIINNVEEDGEENDAKGGERDGKLFNL